MSDLSETLLTRLLWSTAMLTLAVGFFSLIFKRWPNVSPRLHRIGWGTVLAIGANVTSVGMPVLLKLPVAAPRESVNPITPMIDASSPPDGASTMPALAEKEPQVQRELANFRQSESAPQRTAERSWPVVVILAWLAGIGILCTLGVIQQGRLMATIRKLLQRPNGGDGWKSDWEAMISRLPARPPIDLVVAERVGPLLCVCGRRYALVVPASLEATLTSAQRRAVIEHELAHWRRGDLWTELAARLLASVHWFNPLAWLAVRRFGEAAEWACDDAAADHDEQRTCLAAALLTLCDSTARPVAQAAAAQGGDLSRRIRRLLTPIRLEDSLMKRLSIVLFAAVLLAVGALQLKIVGQEAPLRDVATREAEAELMKSAQTAYEGILAAQEVDQAELSDLYAWSVRWLNAAVRAAATPEERLAAFRDHHDRVMVQHRNVEARWKHGVKGGEEFTYRAAIYYLREAELWLADAQNAQR